MWMEREQAAQEQTLEEKHATTRTKGRLAAQQVQSAAAKASVGAFPFLQKRKPSVEKRGERPAPAAQMSGEMSPEEAMDSFRDALAALDDALEQELELSERQQYELYNQASGSFTALSRYADLRDPSEARHLEEAYAQMKQRMAALDLDRHGGAFKSEITRSERELGRRSALRHGAQAER